MTMKSKKILIGIFIPLLLCSCGKSESDKQKEAIKTFTAKKEPTTITLYFKGTIQPIRNVAVVSPTDGIIKQLNFEYGNLVNKGQSLVYITSERLQDEYRDTFTAFLTAKEDYTNTKTSFAGSTELYKAGILSKEDYSNEQSRLDSSILSYLKAKYDLEKTLSTTNRPAEELEKLSLDDKNQVLKLLSSAYGSLRIIAPASGVALFPSKDNSLGGEDSNGGSVQKLDVGSQIKEGQVIVSIGDLSGLSLTVQVDEININKLKPTQKVTVTGAAFPDITLQGIIQSVGSQAQGPSSDGGSGGLANFPVTITIPTITEQQRKIIHVGMNSQIELVLKTEPRIMVPVSAVFQKGGKDMVTLIDSTSKQEKEIPVRTGQTSVSKVTIINGLSDGDVVVLHD